MPLRIVLLQSRRSALAVILKIQLVHQESQSDAGNSANDYRSVLISTQRLAAQERRI
jgi:hypothetical protein